MTDTSPVTVLVVDDDESVVQLFRRWLEDDYDVLTALDGTEALEVFDGERDCFACIDVVRVRFAHPE